MTVILVASVLVGLRQGIVNLFQEFGPDNIFVFHLDGDPYNPRLKPEELTRKPLKIEYAAKLADACPSLKDVCAQIIVPTIIGGRALTAKYRGVENEKILVEGGTWNFAQVTNAELSGGRSFTRDEEHRRAKVCMLGANVATSLFADRGSVRQNHRDGRRAVPGRRCFRKEKGSFFGENRQDNVILIPAVTALSRYPGIEAVVLYCQATPGLRASALFEVESELRRLRGLKSGQPTDFHISTADLIIEQFDRVTFIIRSSTIAISGLGLLIGGIGVMNIMLMSVTQRTREIGVRKAVGARRRDIIWQFLLEAALLTTGGVLGVVLAVILGLALGYSPNLPAVPPLWAIASGLGVSTLVGILFGVWPAAKAADLDPVESLRYE